MSDSSAAGQVAAGASGKLLFLDGLRGIAATYVVLGHARVLFWEGYNDGYLTHPSEYSVFEKLQMYFFSLFKYGHEAVLFFFVLSGFVIHLKYAARFSRCGTYNFKYGEYLLKRVRRIYPPFIFAIVLTLVFDSLGSSLGFSIYSGSTPYQNLNLNNGNTVHDVRTSVGNLFFLYKAYCPIYGTNGPAWSLKFEWWFYMLYPAFLYSGLRKYWTPTLLLLALFVLAILPLEWPEKLSQDVFSMMLSWWLGVLLADVYCGRIRISLKEVSLLMVSAFLLPLTSKFNEILYLTNIALFFTGMLAFFMSRSEGLHIRILSKIKKVGDFSYTLYIIHYPILVFLSGWLLSRTDETLPRHSYYIMPVTGMVLVISYFVHFLTEIPFIRKGIK